MSTTIQNIDLTPILPDGFAELSQEEWTFLLAWTIVDPLANAIRVSFLESIDNGQTQENFSNSTLQIQTVGLLNFLGALDETATRRHLASSAFLKTAHDQIDLTKNTLRPQSQLYDPQKVEFPLCAEGSKDESNKSLARPIGPEAYHQSSYRLAKANSWNGGRHFDEDDVAQDACIRAAKGKPPFDGRFVYTNTKQAWIDRLRKKANRPESLGPGIAPTIPSACGDFHESDTFELREIFSAQFAQLADDLTDEEIFVLKRIYLHGEKQAVIAEKLNEHFPSERKKYVQSDVSKLCQSALTKLRPRFE